MTVLRLLQEPNEPQVAPARPWRRACPTCGRSEPPASAQELVDQVLTLTAYARGLEDELTRARALLRAR
jgi:hypothetical protein